MQSAHIVYWNNIPSPYVVGRFNAVARRGNLGFEAWFNDRREPDRSWSVEEHKWAFPARYVPISRIAGRELRLPVPELNATKPDLLICLYGSASFTSGALAAQASGYRVAFRVLPTFESWVPRSKAREAAKHLLFRSVEAAKVPGPDGAAYAARYGLGPDRTFPVTQTIDVEHYASARALPNAERSRQRKHLGLRGCVFLYVGRLWAGKGLDYLFDAFATLSEQRDDVSLLVFGDGVDGARYRERAKGQANVVFVDFVQPADLPGYYALADALVFPTLGDPHGLVVEEAMAAALPVISTSASGDIRLRLGHEQAGVVVPPADATALAEQMMRFAGDPELRARLGTCGSELVTSRAHEQYAIDFEHFVERVLALPRRTGPAVVASRALGTAIRRLAPARAPSPYISGYSVLSSFQT